MRMMIDLGNQRGPLPIMNPPITSVDCGREVRLRRISLRSLVECMVPCCAFQPAGEDSDSSGASDIDSTPAHHPYHHANINHNNHPTTSTVTGTFFGYRKGRVSFCLQDDTRSCRSPLLLLEFAIPTAYLAREMQYGLLRVALECDQDRQKEIRSSSCPLLEVPIWSLYCNGRKVGFAVRRHMTVSDVGVLKLMQSVSVGAGVLPAVPLPTSATSNSNKSDHHQEDGDLMYLRASFQRVIGSVDSQSFHMINPVGSSGQELSIFLLRS